MPHITTSTAAPMIAFFGIAVLFAMVMAIGVVFVLASRRRLHSRPDFTATAKRLLTQRELRFFELLDAALGGAPVHICPQASIDGFISFGGDRGFAERQRYKARRPDFVIIDAKSDVLLVVELDDPSHDRKKEEDAARDRMIAMAGIPTLRVPKGGLPSAAALKAMIKSTQPRIAIR